MNDQLAIYLILGALLISATGCVKHGNSVEINGEKISVEIADSEAERQRGLMYREELCWDCGMMFVFEEEDKWGFWMKDTMIALDIVYIDGKMEVVDVYHAEPFNEDVYIPEKKAKYVLEVNRGRLGEIIGEKVVLD